MIADPTRDTWQDVLDDLRSAGLDIFAERIDSIRKRQGVNFLAFQLALTDLVDLHKQSQNIPLDVARP